MKKFIDFFVGLPAKTKQYIAGSAVIIIVLFLIRIWMNQKIKEEAKKLQLERDAKMLEAKSDAVKAERERIHETIDELDKKIEKKNNELEEANKAFTERVNVSRMSDRNKKELWEELFGDEQ